MTTLCFSKWQNWLRETVIILNEAKENFILNLINVSYRKFAGLVPLIEKNKLENIYKSYGTDKSFRVFIKMIA